MTNTLRLSQTTNFNVKCGTRVTVCVLNVDQHVLAGGSAAVCTKCFRLNFAQLVYQYREDVPRDDLPGYNFICTKIKFTSFAKDDTRGVFAPRRVTDCHTGNLGSVPVSVNLYSASS